MTLLSPNLEAFMKVAERGTVLHASKELGITQTAATQRIRSLEGDLRSTLFTRSRRGMRLTEEGVALLRYCQSALELEGIVYSKLGGTKDQAFHRVVISGPSSVMRTRVIPGISRIRDAWPHVYFSIEFTDDPFEPLHDLKEGRCHFAILDPKDVTHELDSKKLRSQKYVMIGPTSWARRELEEILNQEPIVDFDETDRLTEMYLRKHKLGEDSRIKERIFCNNTDGILSLVLLGRGYSVLPVDFVDPELKRRELVYLHPGGSLLVPLALAWYPRPEMPDWFRQVIAAIH